jgi:hypothetical protein
MFELKRISQAAVPGALQKAERYRLLNEPEQAESIARDVLAVAPDNELAQVTLLLALTDQFRARNDGGIREAEEALQRLADGYARAYYGGIIRERWALALLAAGDPGHQAFAWLRDAMRAYEQAGGAAPAGNDDAILRWNACARIIDRHALHGEAELDDIDAGDGAPQRR